MPASIRVPGTCSLIVWVMVGCASAPAGEPDATVFMVSKDQQSQLNEVFLKVTQRAMDLPRGELSREQVAGLLAGYDDDVVIILNAAQFDAYRGEHRKRFAEQVYRDVMRQHRSAGIGSRVGSGVVRGTPSPVVENH